MVLSPTVPLKGFKLCPVCGCRYQGALDKHLDEKLGLAEIERKGRIYGANSSFPQDLAEARANAVTRCEWRLVEARILRATIKLGEDGWRLAGSLGAKVAILVATTHKHLAQHTTSGSVPMTQHRRHFDPANDPIAWWIKKWAYPLTQVSRWSLRKRAQIITELDGLDEVQEVIEAAYRVAGVDAVALLEGTAIPHRCNATHGDAQKAILRPVGGKPVYQCILPKGHPTDVAHKDFKTGLLWTDDWNTFGADPRNDPTDTLLGEDGNGDLVMASQLFNSDPGPGPGDW